MVQYFCYVVVRSFPQKTLPSFLGYLLNLAISLSLIYSAQLNRQKCLFSFFFLDLNKLSLLFIYFFNLAKSFLTSCLCNIIQEGAKGVYVIALICVCMWIFEHERKKRIVWRKIERKVQTKCWREHKHYNCLPFKDDWVLCVYRHVCVCVFMFRNICPVCFQSVCVRQSEKKSINRDYATLPLAFVTHAPVAARRFPHLHTEVSKSTPSAAPVPACPDKALHRLLNPGFAAA